MFDRLDDILIHYEEIMQELGEPNVTENQDRFRKLMKEQADSFIPHRNARRDLETVKRVGLEHYRETLGKKMEGLRFLLERCNDGRRK